MPRSNRPRRSRSRPPAPTGPPRVVVEEVDYAGVRWAVRRVRGGEPDRSYRCPGCQHDVPGSAAHVVVWPREAMRGLENRRHWHTACWSARERRRPGGSFA